MEDLGERLAAVRSRIDRACEAAGREVGSVRLVAVSKRKPAGMVRELRRAGQRDFGENYCSGGIEKMETLADEDDICWQYIGAVQSRKAAAIAGAFDWVHSVDRLKVAERLARARERHPRPLDVCIQMDIGRESGKAGVATGLDGLRLRGLMVLPRPTLDLSGSVRRSARCAGCATTSHRTGPRWTPCRWG